MKPSQSTLDATIGQRIAVVGTSGAGKTSLAAHLSVVLNCPHVDLDELHWRPNWQKAPQEEFLAALKAAIADEAWIVAGNYSSTREQVQTRAETLIWLDYSLSIILWRHLKRAWRRVVRGESCCNGNYETLRQSLSRDAAWWYALKTYHRRKREYNALINSPAASHLQILHFQSPRQTECWLREMTSASKVL
jgi:adenylate kinase family enzyme